MSQQNLLDSILRANYYHIISEQKFKVFKNTLANNNAVFLIESAKQKYILRQSNQTTVLSHLRLEVDVLEYLHNKQFSFTPCVIPNAKGRLITQMHNHYYILENFLPGDVQKSVNNLTRFNSKKLQSLFYTLATFSRAVEEYPGKISNHNQPLFYYVQHGKKLFIKSLRKIKNPKIKQLLQDDHAFITHFVLHCKQNMEKISYDALPKQIVHFDVHPGNVNYTGDTVTGLFDFDWVRFDSRFTDLACTIGQSCYSYHGKQRAKYDTHKIKLGLKAYRKAYGESNLSAQKENNFVKEALKGYMFYQLLWIIDWSNKNPQDVHGFEYVRFSLDVLKFNDFDWLI